MSKLNVDERCVSKGERTTGIPQGYYGLCFRSLQ